MKKVITLALVFLLCVLPMAASDELPPVVYQLNQDFFSEIGMTQSQLNEKYDGSIDERFLSDTYAEYKKVPHRMYYFENGRCVEILNFAKGELLTNYDLKFSPEEVAQQYGLKYLLSRGEVDMVQSYYLKDNNIISITTKPSALEDVRSINQLATIDEFNTVKYQGLYFNPKGINSRYQTFGDIAIGVPEDATIEDFLNDPLAQAVSDAWLSDSWGGEKITFFSDEGEVTSGKLTPGMMIYAGNARFSVIPYVEELKQQ